MTVTNHTAAPDAEFVARFGEVEGRGVRVENAARAIFTADANPESWQETFEQRRDLYRALATAALVRAALRPVTEPADGGERS